MKLLKNMPGISEKKRKLLLDMNYLIDTDVVIDFLKSQAYSLSFFDTLAEQHLYISVITLIEIEYGLMKTHEPEKRRKEFESFLKHYFIKTVAIEPSIGTEFIKIKVNLEKKKLPLADFDLFIAATAIANDFTLVTRNDKHFSRIDDIRLFDF